MLEILEIDVNRLLPIYHPAQFENIILPDESFFHADNKINFTPEYREAIEIFRDFAIKNQTPTSSKKIYYFYGMAQTGEERLAEYFRTKGYEIISPEKLTFDEQLNVLINAESFASTLGSCAHNSVFTRDGTEIILIPRAANRIPGYQQTLNQLHPVNATYIDSTLSVFETMNGPYCFIISRQLKNFFGDEFSGYEEDDFKIFLTYVRKSISGGYQFNDNSLQYYAPIYQEFIEQLKQREDLLKAFDVTLV